MKLRVYLYLLAAFVPGSCSVRWAWELYRDNASAVRYGGFQLWMIFDPWIWLNILGFFAIPFFGFLAWRQGEEKVEMVFIFLAVLAIIGAILVWLFIAALNQIG